MHGLSREDETLPTPPGGLRSSSALPTVGNTGRYRVLEEIARGGMGAVLRVLDPEMDRVLALKVLLEEHLHDPEMLQRFLEEARIAARLQHPGIVPIHDVGRFSDDRPYFLMKLVEGRTLSDLLAHRENPGEDLPRFVGVFEQVCQTIAYAHSRGVIHRDLKPANIMVGRFGEVQVMDWGLAKQLHAPDAPIRDSMAESSGIMVDSPGLTRAGSILGTPAYMAPEQADGQPLDERTDVFGLGGILCEILTGQPTFVLPGSVATWLLAPHRDLDDAHRRLQACNADPDLVALARDCLQARPEDRPLDAGVVAARMVAHHAIVQDRLRRVELERATARASAEAARTRVRVERRARRLLLGLATTIVVLIGLAGGVIWWLEARHRETLQRIQQLLDRTDQLTEQAQANQDSNRALEGWRAASSTIEQAWQVLESAPGGTSLREAVAGRRERILTEVAQLTRDRTLVERLIDIRISREDDVHRADIDARYVAAFAEYGLPVDGDVPVSDLAEQVRPRPPGVRREITTALDEWSQQRRRAGMPVARWRHLLHLASALDTSTWRKEVRELIDRQTSARTNPLLAVDALVGRIGRGFPALGAIVSAIETTRWDAELLALARQTDSDRLSTPSVLLLSSLLRQEGYHTAAVRLLRGVQDRNPGDAWINYAMGQALQHNPNPNLPEALRFYSAARAVRPEMGHAMAHVLIGQGRNTEAEALFRQLVQFRPDNAHHRSCHGWLLGEMGKQDEGIRQLRQAVALAPDHSPGWAHLAGLLFAGGQYAEAERCARRWLHIEPDDPSGHHLLGRILAARGHDEEAIGHWRRAIALNPRQTASYVQLAQYMRSKGDDRGARDLYRSALRAAPGNPSALTGFGLMCWKLGQHRDAIDALRQAVRIDPANESAVVSLVSLLREQNRNAEALPLLGPFLVRQPDHAGGNELLAQILQSLGRTTEALAAFRKAVRVSPPKASLYFYYALAAESVNRYEEAINAYRQALAVQSDHPEALCNLGHVLRDRGEFRLALVYLTRGHEVGRRRSNWQYPSAAWIRACEQLIAIEPQLPAMTAGTFQPKAMPQFVTALRACLIHRRHATRVRLFQRVLEGSPDLLDRLSPGFRTSLAGSALLAGRGRGADAEALTVAQRENLRRQALTWLEYDVKRCHRLLSTRDRDNAALALGNLDAWLGEHMLTEVRAAKGDDDLPPNERAAWRNLWQQVRELHALFKVRRGDPPRS